MNDTKNEPPVQAHDILVAFSLLTRLPIPVDHDIAGERAAEATWAYPLVGAVLGFAVGVMGMLLGWIGTPPGIAAAVILAAFAFLTGAMHEDGLADCADGFGGAAEPDKRLELMKDSRIGAFGAIALVIVLIARWNGFDSLQPGWLPFLLMAVAAASRAPMVLAMYLMDNARKSGLSASVGRPPAVSVALALIIGLVACVAGAGMAGGLIFFWALLGAIPVLLLARRLIGGQTGDVLGASQQCAEVAALAAAVAIFS